MCAADIRAGQFSHRLAEASDMPDLLALMNASIEQLQTGFLTKEQVAASHEVMGLDTQLIKDETYYIVFENETVTGCGGWSRRATLYGGDHTQGRNTDILNSARDSARVRAMYTHPDHTRKGVGRYIINLCEQKASEEGFSSFELMATMAGMPLYEICGYAEVEKENAVSSNGVTVPLMKMRKLLVTA